MGKKHKKKVYTKPKKVKHAHEKVSLSNFIESLNNPRCNSCLSIVAVHSDRNYCGNCEVSNITI